ncbi:MAG: putative PIG3 family NAD(P)H quinone oxidoreductase [Pseudohongiellaceae bacterium]|jgi:putative PIG3 family NAD(P)H quinone oxidoreductase
MRFIDLVHFGGPENLIVGEASAPSPQDTEIKIRVIAAGINRPDIFQRQGLYPAPEGASSVLGLEVAGFVEALGKDVDSKLWQVGNRVCALTNGGGYAEFVTVPEGQCLPIPEGLDFIQAAALPETFFTVWSNLFDRGQLKSGDNVLIHGGASGIGTTAIQMAKCFGATVFTTVSSDEKCKACEILGADKAINYQEEDFVTAVKEATDGKGADIILDIVGGDYIQRNIKAAALDARIINIAYLQGSKTEVDFMPVMLKRLQLSGSTLRSQPTQTKSHIAEQLKKQIWPILERGEMRPLIDSTYDLHKVQQAHQRMESNQNIGKIILIVDDSHIK